MNPITKQVGKWKVTLREQPYNNRWRCEIGDGYGQHAFRECRDAETAIKSMAYAVGENASDWLRAFGVVG